MVPGAPAAWAEIHEQFGKLPFEALFEPAIYYAEHGYAVMPNLAAMLAESWESFAPYREDEAFSGLFSTFFPEGRPAKAGEILRLPDHAASLRLLRDTRCRALYDGELAEAIDAWSRKTGGTSARTIWQNTSPSGSSPSIRTTGATTCGRFRRTATAWSC